MRGGERALRHAVGGGAHRDAEGVERLHGELEARADRADHRAFRHPAAREPEAADGVRDRHGDGRQLEARGVALDEEGGDALASEGRVRAGEDDVVVGDGDVGDERLLAVEHPRVAVAPGGGAQRGDVAAGLGLGEAEGADALAGEHARQAAAPLRLAPGEDERIRAQALHREDGVGERRDLAERLADEHERAHVDVLGPAGGGAAVRLGDEVGVEAEGAHRAGARGGVVLARQRGERGGGEARGERRVAGAEEGPEVVAGEGDLAAHGPLFSGPSQISAPSKRGDCLALLAS